MTKFGISQPVRRVEDQRFLRGEGKFGEDLANGETTRAVFLRSPVAHANIASIDTTAARAVPGVLGIYTGVDLDQLMDNSIDHGLLPNRDGTMGAKTHRPTVAVDRVRYVGEAVALIIAKTADIARDAADQIEVDYDELPVVPDTDRALLPGAAQIHDTAPGNLIFDWSCGDEDATTAAFAKAAHTVSIDIVDNKVIAHAMETRNCLATWDGTRLHISFGGQGPWGAKTQLAAKLGLDAKTVHVSHPDIGGGFGTKAFLYPEYLAVACAAREIGHPVLWASDRVEGALTDSMGRDHYTTCQAAFDTNHKLTALRFDCVAGMGAYCAPNGQYIPTVLAQKVLTGAYDVQTVFMGVKGVCSNTTPVDAYRGAGRPEQIYALERLMDHAAREMKIDPAELRRINFVKQFPYVTAMGETYDVGNYDRVMTRALAEADIEHFPARREDAMARGKARGIGIAFYVESILGQQSEAARIAFAEDGGIDLYVGTQSTGQGHETVFAQILHSRTGVPFDKIRIVQGDSDLVPKGGGTGGSRSVTMQGNAINYVADNLIDAFRPLAEDELEVSAADLVFEDGAFCITGTDRTVDLMTLASRARAMGKMDLLDHQGETEIPARSFPNGCHVAEVEVDPDTGTMLVVRYTVTDDFGVLMNPMLVQGQIHGGVVQGIGQAITEKVAYDEDGQPLATSFMDYAMPRATDAPMIDFSHEGTPSTANAIGMKGCGEAGTVGALAAVTNAGLDALATLGVTHVDMPMTPVRVWEWIEAARKMRAA